MKVLITGNMGYVGPCVVEHLRATFPDATLLGCDQGFFAGCLTAVSARFPESHLNEQYYCDVRTMPVEILRDVDAVVHLAAISNDPMGAKFEAQTMEINHQASVSLAKKAKDAGVKKFVFASSCSVYGYSEIGARSESSEVVPLTAYAKSKVFVERDLKELASDTFSVSCLRFSTACGMSPRLRLDLVLNDFVAGSVTSNLITILSDGSPWRPLIDVHDMALAIEWAIQRPIDCGGSYLVVNVGRDSANYQVCELAEAVSEVASNIKISLNPEARPDRRSYKVDFSLFEKLAPKHQPRFDVNRSITDMYNGLINIGFRDQNFRNSTLVRLVSLESLLLQGHIDDSFSWVSGVR